MNCLVLVDVANLYFCAKKVFNSRVDFAKLLSHILHERTLHRAIAFGSKLGTESNNFIGALRIIGYLPVFKEPKVWQNGDGSQNRKADWDVAIAMTAIRYMSKVDVVCFVTADGDLAPCVEYLRERGTVVEIYGIKISSDLRNTADVCEELSRDLMIEDVEHANA
jgi:uncharacterized LabA/DUF88 family protein